MIKSDQQDMLLRLCDHYEGKTTKDPSSFQSLLAHYIQTTQVIQIMFVDW